MIQNLLPEIRSESLYIQTFYASAGICIFCHKIRQKRASKPHGALWYNAGRFLYVFCALILCLVALFMKVAF